MREEDFLSRIQIYLDDVRIDKVEMIMDIMTDRGATTDMLSQVLEIYKEETANGSLWNSFSVTTDIKKLTAIYVKLKLMLRRIEFNVTGQEEIVDYCINNKLSAYYLAHVINTNMIHKNRIINSLVKQISGSVMDENVKTAYLDRLYNITLR